MKTFDRGFGRPVVGSQGLKLTPSSNRLNVIFASEMGNREVLQFERQ